MYFILKYFGLLKKMTGTSFKDSDQNPHDKLALPNFQTMYKSVGKVI